MAKTPPDSLIIKHDAGAHVETKPVKIMEENKEQEDIISEEEKVEESEETVDSLKEKLAKSEEEKENYKQGMLKYKEQSKDEPVWDDDSKKFQKETLTKAEELAKQAAIKAIEAENEKTAISKFKEAYPDEDIKKVLTYYKPVSGKFNQESVYKDLEGALVLQKHYSGELAGEAAKAEQKGEKKGMAKAKIAELNTMSGSPKKPAPGGKEISDNARRIAEQMRLDPEEVAEVGEGPTTIRIQ